MNGPWASLQEATETVRAAGVENPTEVIRQAVSAALIVRPGTLPLPDRTPPAPRLRVISQRTPDTEMMDWLQAPVLDFEKSEILCRSFMPRSWEELNRPRNVHPARIELWNDDLLRLWPTVETLTPESHMRFSLDDALLIEAKAGLQSKRWPNVNKAAEELAERAEGDGTAASKVDRLRKKISKFVQRSPNIPKD